MNNEIFNKLNLLLNIRNLIIKILMGCCFGFFKNPCFDEEEKELNVTQNEFSIFHPANHLQHAIPPISQK